MNVLHPILKEPGFVTRSLLRRVAIGTLFGVFALASLAGRPTAASAAATCYQATGLAAHLLCWLDLTSYTPTEGVAQTISFTLPVTGGGTLSATFQNTSTTNTPTIVAFPTYSGSPLGHTAYTGVLGKPAIYSGNTAPTTVSAISVVDGQGTTLPNVTIIAADDETLDTGDGTAGKIIWTTAGTSWAQLQIMNSVTSNAATPICTLTGLATATATCVPSAGGNNAAYVLKTTVTPTQNITMSSTTASLQGYAFAIEVASLTLQKNIVARSASGDQFTVTTSAHGTSLATATTTGTATTATTGSIFVIPADTYTMAETASGTTTLSNYVSTYACTNATTTSTTTLPSGTGTTFTLSPAPDDQITCTFTNDALSLTDTANTPTNTYAAGASVTDVFTLKNTSAVSGTFNVLTPTLTPSSGGAITPTGYTFNGNTYTTIAALQTAINAAGATAAGGTISVGVTYTTPSTGATSVAVTLPADIASGTSTSPQQSATDTDTITVANIAIAKTGTTAASPGGLIAYSILVTNNGPQAANGATVSDPLPAGLVYESSACKTTTNGAVCATPTTTVSGGVTTVNDTITTFPATGTATITIFATAGAGPSYTNTATVTPPTGVADGTTTSSSLTTTVAQGNGISKTVTNLTHTAYNSGSFNTTTNNAGVPGDQLQYALSFTNNTGQALSSFSFIDNVPTNTTYVSSACPTSFPTNLTACSATQSAGVVTFTFTGTLAAGSTIGATFTVKIN